MKKIKLLSVLMFGFILAINPLNALATSGACSSHEGVNCKVVSAMGGSAICNDGYVSSTQYSNTDECKQTTSPSYCLPPIAGLCTTENDLSRMTVEGYRSGSAEYSSSWQGTLDACRSAITNYQAQQLSYQSCLNSQSSIFKPTPITPQTFDKDAYVNSEMQKWCVSKYGPNSFNDTANKTCSCHAGYEFDSGYKSCQKIVTCDSNQIKQNNKCVDVDQACMTYFGPHSIAIPNTIEDGSTQCSCSAGYEWAKNKADGCIETKVNTPNAIPLIVEKKVQTPKAINPIKEIPKIETPTIVKPVATEAWVDNLTQGAKPVKQSFFKRIGSWFVDLFR